MGSDSSKLAPQALSDLTENTSFTEDEIRRWYKDFRRDFPDGELSIEQFKDVYVQHFPDGDATKFAEHVFRTFDKDHDHQLNFREFMTALSVTARGDSADRLRWAFQMYDIDENGYISKAECTEIVQALYKTIGESRLSNEDLTTTPQQRTEQIFANVDVNKDDKLTLEEFVNGANMDPIMMKMFQKKKF